MIEDKVSMTNTPPITTKLSSWEVNIATVAKVAPRARLPVSPMNTLAGCVL